MSDAVSFSSASKTQVHAPRIGIACMVASTMFITLNDAAVKWVSTGIPVGEIIFFRGLFALIVTGLFVWRTARLDALRVSNVRGIVARASCMVVGTFLFVSGLAVMPLADVVSIVFIGPLLITAMAPLLLGEHVGWHRWSAVGAGFVGMIVMLRPTGGGLYWLALLPVGAAFTGALRDIITRRLSATDSSLAILIYCTAAVTAAGLATLPFGWRTPGLLDLALLGFSGLMLFGAHFLMIEAFRYAQVAVVSPFKYVALVWAVMVGYLLWADIPDQWTLTGGGLIIASGLYVLHRETRRRSLASHA